MASELHPPIRARPVPRVRSAVTFLVAREPTLVEAWRHSIAIWPSRLPLPVLLALGASAFIATFATLVCSVQSARPPAPVAALAPVLPDGRDPLWIDVKRPFTMFDLTGGASGRLPVHYTAKRDEAGTARQDTLTYGQPVPKTSFVRITFYRKGDERIRDASLFVDVARSAAEAGLAILRSGLPRSLVTRFGLFEIADMTLVGSGASGACLGFRRAGVHRAEPLALTGVACDGDRTIELKTLACTLDKLDLVSAGDDEALQRFFVDAEQKRGLGCTTASVAAADLAAPSFPLSLKHSIGATD